MVLPCGGRGEVSHCGHILADRDSESSPGVPGASLSMVLLAGCLGRFAGQVSLNHRINQDHLFCLPQRLWCGLQVLVPPLFFPGPQTCSKKRLSSPKGPCLSALDPALLPLFLSPRSSKASCPSTGSLSSAVSFPRPSPTALSSLHQTWT